MSLAKRNSEAAAKWATKRRESKERAALREEPPSAFSRHLSTSSQKHPQQRQQQQERYLASNSHVDNAAFMDHFREGLAKMRLATTEGSGGADDDAISGVPKERQGRSYLAPQSKSSVDATALGVGTGQHGESVVLRIKRQQHIEQQGGIARSDTGLLADELRNYIDGDGVVSGWRQGPLDPAGNLLDLSDRNLLCASVKGDEAVFGCADHALYGVDLSRGLKTRRLYGSRSKPDAGHKEWVSAVCHTAMGDVASGGMDGKLCLWPGGGGDPAETQAHRGPISGIKADSKGRVVTSGYEGGLRVWDCRDGSRSGGPPPRMSCELFDRSLPAPCMEFAWSGGRAITGHRDGRLGVFDLETGTIAGGGCIGAAHRGHVTVVKSLDRTVYGSNTAATAAGINDGDRSSAGVHCFVTGGQDGFVRIWDARAGEIETGGYRRRDGGGAALVLEVPAHRGQAGVGAVGDVIVVGATGTRLVSFGADKRVCVLDMRGGRGGGSESSAGIPDSSSSRSRNRRPKEESTSTGALAIEHAFNDHRDFIYCMDFVPAGSGGSGGVLITGGGDGMLLAHDLGSMRLLYGLGCCSTGAVRCAVVGESRLTVAGDDGNAMLYSFGDISARGSGK